MSDEHCANRAGSLPTDLSELIDRLALLPRGLAFLHLASLDTIAIVLGLDPRVVDRARDMLKTEDGRARMIEEFRKAKARAPEVRADWHPKPPPAMRPIDSVEGLIRHAEEHPLGLRFLMDAPLETAAIMFHAHAFLVSEAREVLRTRYGLEERSTNGDDW